MVGGLILFEERMAASGLGGKGGGEQEERRERELWLVCKMNKNK